MPDYWTGWREGWAAATNAIFEAQHRTQAAGSQKLIAGMPEAAGNKPAPRRRGRPPKSLAALTPDPPRRRGRPPKQPKT